MFICKIVYFSHTDTHAHPCMQTFKHTLIIRTLTLKIADHKCHSQEMCQHKGRQTRDIYAMNSREYRNKDTCTDYDSDIQMR